MPKTHLIVTLISVLTATTTAYGKLSRSLLEQVRSVRKQARHLDVAIDGSYNIKFSQCVDIKLRDDDLFADEVIEYVQDGQITSTKSYVLFHLCQNDTCFYEAEDDLYLLDLKSYLKNVAEYHAGKREKYCGACDDMKEYCLGDDEYSYSDDEVAAAQAEDQEQQNDAEVDEEQEEVEAEEVQQEEEDAQEEAADANNEQRKLKQATRNLSTVISCDRCQSYDCYNENSTQTETDEAVTNLIDDLASCLPTNQYWNNEQLYISAMCSPYGDGVELAVFLDNECTVYTNKANFADVYANYIAKNGLNDFSGDVEVYIKSAFEEELPCKEMEYANPDEVGDDDNYGDANEYCQQIFAKGAIDFNQCYSQNYNFGSNNQEDDEYSWYTYDMTYDEANDLDDVCTVVYQMSGEYTYSYDEEKSGTWYNRDKSGSIKPAKSSNGLGFSPLTITLFVLLGVAIFGVAALLSYRKSRARRMEPLYQGGAMI